ncbi:opioid-binding protein/cell adhesion molecule-like isoform X2 [Hemitrygon akajei]|uniref:opioid-binding protein/cell adhesion molecule-like isoform X2 n=1 Tax=Hemitrygon akajei TaxID=2704970 RepID=UPI003BFA0010
MKGILEMDLNLQIYFYLVLCANVYSERKFVTLKCEETVTGIFNEDTILPCNLTTAKPSKPKLLIIELRKYDGNNTLVFKFNGSHNPRKAQDRIKLLSPDPQNVSLVLQKTELSDSGKYIYFLDTDLGYQEADIVLVVKAPYSLPKLALVNLTETTKVVTCETTGYPSAQIHWTVDGKNLTLSSETKKEETAQGLISIISTLPIITSETDQEYNYTCAVWNEAERKYEARNSISTPYSLPKLALVNLAEMTKVVTCETTGYPSAQIHWTVDGKNLTLNSKTERKETAQGLISIISTLPIITSETDQEYNYTCAVWNEAERKYEARNSISITNQPINDQPPDEKGLTAVGIVVGGLAVGIFFLALLKFCRRYHPVRQFNEEAGNQMLKKFVAQL